MSDLTDRIVELIHTNRISSVEVADALGKSGVVPGLSPVNQGAFAAGKVEYIYGFNESNWPIHEQAEDLKGNSIVFCDLINCKDKAAFGDLVAKYIVYYKNAKACVINGLMRDIHTLKKQNYPVWCTGVTPLGCYNKPVELDADTKAIVDERRALYEGAVMICDDSGCTMIEKHLLTEETYKKLEFIEVQEDIWSYCINTLKWSTYKTVCEKAYLNDPAALPKALADKLTFRDLEK